MILEEVKTAAAARDRRLAAEERAAAEEKKIADDDKDVAKLFRGMYRTITVFFVVVGGIAFLTFYLTVGNDTLGTNKTVATILGGIWAAFFVPLWVLAHIRRARGAVVAFGSKVGPWFFGE